MDLELTADQAALRDAARELLDAQSPLTLARSVHERTGDADQLWQRLVDLGWPGLTVPETSGGLGLGCVELAIVCEELGAHATPSPFLATAGYAALLRECGSELVAEVVTGRTGSIALAEHPSRWAPQEIAAAVGTSGTVEAVKHQVLDATTASAYAVVVRDGAELAVAVVPSRDTTATRVSTLDPTRPWGSVSVSAAGTDTQLLRGQHMTAAVGRAVEELTVALCADMVGAAQRALDLTLEHARNREQFGVPIGSFQAVKHRLVDMHVAIERARATTYHAALAIAEDVDQRTLAVHLAKAAAGDAARVVAQDAIQLHGGVGYTWEHDVHLLAKRAKSGEALLGSASWHRQRIADLVGLSSPAATA